MGRTFGAGTCPERVRPESPVRVIPALRSESSVCVIREH